MEKDIFIKEITNFIDLKKKSKAVTLMKRMWIKISIEDATALVHRASVYHFEKNERSFPKIINGVLYNSAGHYIYCEFNAEQQLAVENSVYDLKA